MWIRHQHKPAIAESSKNTPHIKSHRPFFPSPETRDTRSCLFQSGYSHLDHHRWDSQIARTKTSYCLIEPQPLPCTPAFCCQFHAFVVHPLPKFTAPLVRSTFRTWSEVCSGTFLWKQSTCYSHRLFSVRSSIVDVWQNSKCDSVWRFFTTEVTQGNLELPLLSNSIHSHQTWKQ